MNAELQSPASKAEPLRPMSWLDWQEDGDGYAGGDYRVRLLEPFRWEVLRNGEHVLFHQSRSGAMDEAETHYREGLRRRDMTVNGLTVVLATAALLVTFHFVLLNNLWTVLVFSLYLHVALTSLGRLTAALTRSRFDPFRRKAPWEKRSWRYR